MPVKVGKFRKIKKAKKAAVKPPTKPTVLANNASPRPIVPRNRPKTGGTGSNTTHHQHVHSVCALTNPFCPAAKGSKWPDGTQGNTMTQQFRGNVTIASLAAGNNAVVFAGSAPYGYLAGNTSTATAVTFPAGYTFYKDTSLLATYGVEYRIVSMGVIFRCVASATTAAGLLTIGTSTPPAVSTSLTLGQEAYSEVQVVAIQPGMEITWISQPRGTGAREFVALSTATVVSPDWTACIMEIAGAAASTALINAEWFVNIEFTLPANSDLAPLAKQNPPKVPHAETAVSTVHTMLGSFLKGGVSTIEGTIKEAASAAVTSFTSNPLGALGSLFALF